MHWANDRLWQATEYPCDLSHDLNVASLWYDPDLLVTQACGLDLFLSAAPIEPVAAPVFDLDCQAGMYFSYLVGDLNGSKAAVNSLSSRSGYSALLTMCTPQSLLVTGSHQASLVALKTGQAEVAAIDAVTWQIIERETPAMTSGLEIVARSAPATAPPFVVRRGVDGEPVFRRLRSAFDAPQSAAAKSALLIKDILAVQREDYLPILSEYRDLINIPATDHLVLGELEASK